MREKSKIKIIKKPYLLLAVVRDMALVYAWAGL